MSATLWGRTCLELSVSESKKRKTILVKVQRSHFGLICWPSRVQIRHAKETPLFPNGHGSLLSQLKPIERHSAQCQQNAGHSSRNSGTLSCYIEDGRGKTGQKWKMDMGNPLEKECVQIAAAEKKGWCAREGSRPLLTLLSAATAKSQRRWGWNYFSEL